jgi:hypothetical protein
MKLLRSETAASEVVGHMLILFITILGVGMITLYGVPAIYSLEDIANSKNSEQAFTVLDSRASRVTLGESPLQVTDIDLGGGTMTAVPNSTNNPSYMVVNSSNFNVVIPMGKVKYNLGDRIVAYEGGGVWAQYPGGGTVMLSPPEFHYDGVTLTLPVIHFYGNASIGGKGTVAISIKKNATVILYPNTTCSDPDCPNRINPVNYSQTGKVYVNITSDYYLAWADYARTLGYTKVITNDKNRSISIELRVIPSNLGQNTQLTNPITFRGLNTTGTKPLDNFSFKLYGKQTGQFLDWDIRATSPSGTKTLIFYMKDTSLTVGYQDTAYSKPVETWGTINYITKTDSNGEYIDVDLLNTSLTLDYSNQVPVGSNSGCANRIDRSSNFNSTDFSWDNIIINTSISNPNRTQSLYNITQHYFLKMAQEGDIYFNTCASGAVTPDLSDSTMLQNYTAVGAITYLHITENKADVAIS